MGFNLNAKSFPAGFRTAEDLNNFFVGFGVGSAAVGKVVAKPVSNVFRTGRSFIDDVAKFGRGGKKAVSDSPLPAPAAAPRAPSMAREAAGAIDPRIVGAKGASTGRTFLLGAGAGAAGLAILAPQRVGDAAARVGEGVGAGANRIFQGVGEGVGGGLAAAIGGAGRGVGDAAGAASSGVAKIALPVALVAGAVGLVFLLRRR